MKTVPLFLLAAVLIGSGFTAPVRAQAEQAQTTLRLLTLPPRVEHPPLFLVQGEGAALPLEVASSRLTGPYKATAANRWRFSLTADPVREEGKSQLAASCRQLPSAANQLVVLARNPGDPVSYKAFAVDIGPDAFKERQFLIVNLSPTPIAGEIGGERMAFPPGQPVLVSPKADLGEDLCHAKFVTRKDQGPWRPFFSTNWPLKDKVRGLIFFYQIPGGGKILMHTVSDFLCG